VKQQLESWCWHQAWGRCLNCELMLPSLRRKNSRFHEDFQRVEGFLNEK
jgi:hypothetical protein